MRFETMVRVTLLEPFKSKDGLVILGDGLESRVPFNAVAASDMDFENPGACAPMGTDTRDPRNGRRVNNSVPIVYTLKYEDKAMRSVDVPASCAKRWFGDWTIVPGQESNAAQLTWSMEKFRVAMVWGDFGFPRALIKGDVDQRKIRPPRMPKVKLEILDQRNHLPSGDAILPTELWNFEADLDVEAIAEMQRREVATGKSIPAGTFDLSALTAADIAKLKKLFAEA